LAEHLEVIMKTGRIAAAIGIFVGGALAVQPVLAQTAPFPTAARNYTAWMARAMDQCSPTTVSVVSTPGLPTTGCYQANSTTDSVITMKYARLTVSSKTGKLALFGSGFPFGARVTTQLTLRVTKRTQATKHPPGPKTVTFEDVTVQCPNTPFWFVARPNGSVLGSVRLSDCLTTPGLATGNIEILDSALINVDTGKVFARPGILR
jgi:hypothetical protein